MAKPLHEIMAESSAGLALANAKKKQDIADRKSYGLGNLEARIRQNTGTGGGTGMGPQMGTGRRRRFGQGKISNGILNTLKDFYGKMTAPGFFGGLQGAEINPQKVLASDWAKQQVDWEDLEGGTFSPIGYDAAYKKLKNRGDLSTWGDLYGLLQSGGGTGLTNKVLEKGLGSFASEMGETGMFPKNWSPFQVEPTVESWKGRDYFDIDEGDLEKGRYDELRNAGWLY